MCQPWTIYSFFDVFEIDVCIRKYLENTWKTVENMENMENKWKTMENGGKHGKQMENGGKHGKRCKT